MIIDITVNHNYNFFYGVANTTKSKFLGCHNKKVGKDWLRITYFLEIYLFIFLNTFIPVINILMCKYFEKKTNIKTSHVYCSFVYIFIVKCSVFFFWQKFSNNNETLASKSVCKSKEIDITLLLLTIVSSTLVI